MLPLLASGDTGRTLSVSGSSESFFDPNNAPACYCRSVSRSESQEAGAPCLLAHPEVAPPFCSLD